MRLTDLTTLAADHGWHNDTTWTRAHIRTQHSKSVNGHIVYVTQPQHGPVHWNIQPDDTTRNPTRSRIRAHGTAPSVNAARQAAQHALSHNLNVLF